MGLLDFIILEEAYKLLKHKNTTPGFRELSSVGMNIA